MVAGFGNYCLENLYLFQEFILKKQHHKVPEGHVWNAEAKFLS